MADCDEMNIFKQILNGTIPSHKIFENDDVLAILDAFPTVPGHSLLIPKANTVDIRDMTEESAAKCMQYIPKLANIVQAATGCDGVNIISNAGSCAGQMVFHTHIHVIPRTTDDNLIKFPAGVKLSTEDATAMLAKMSTKSANSI